MSRFKQGNIKRKSRFICLKCKEENQIGTGITRNNQREKYHIKDLYCIKCNLVTKNIEVRSCDYIELIKENVNEYSNFYYAN